MVISRLSGPAVETNQKCPKTGNTAEKSLMENFDITCIHKNVGILIG